MFLVQKRCGLPLVHCSLCNFQAGQSVISYGTPFRWAETLLTHFKQHHLLVCIDVAKPLVFPPRRDPSIVHLEDEEGEGEIPDEVFRMGFTTSLVNQRRVQLYNGVVKPYFKRWAIKFALLHFQNGAFSSYMCIICRHFFTEKKTAEHHLIKNHCEFDQNRFVPRRLETSDSDE